MPHYKNGREAHIGEIAAGPTYNRIGRQIGVIVGITPSSETCNCRLATRFNSIPCSFDVSVLVPVVPQDYNSTGGYDYTAVSDLLHIDDYIASLSPVQVVQGNAVPQL